MLASFHLLSRGPALDGQPASLPQAAALPLAAAAPAAGAGLAASAAGIEQLAFLVGGVWAAAYDPGDPAAVIEERCTWGLADRFIFTEVTQRGGGAVLGTARGAFGFDPAAGQLRSWSFSSSGTFQSAVQTGGGAVPPSWVFLSTLLGKNPGEAQVTMTQEAADAMVVAQQPAGGAAKSLLYRRRAE